jgi:hypothetical protein
MPKSITLEDLNKFLKPKPLQALPPHDRLTWEPVPVDLHNEYYEWYIELGFVYIHRTGTVDFLRGGERISLADLKRVVWHAPFSLVADMRGDEKLSKLKSLCVYYDLCAEHVDAFVEVCGVNRKKLQAAMTVIWQVMREDEDEDEETGLKRAASPLSGDMAEHHGGNKGKKARFEEYDGGMYHIEIHDI